VSSADQKADLDRWVARVTVWATGQQIPIDKVVVEVGSALNGHRRKFVALLGDPWVHRIVVEHRDRFCRFGSESVQAALAARGRELVVVQAGGREPCQARIGGCRGDREAVCGLMAKFEVPDGWCVQAFRFTLDPIEGQARALARHFGARRKAYNWTVATLKADIEAWHAAGIQTAKPLPERCGSSPTAGTSGCR
jgi:hypothetical protein